MAATNGWAMVCNVRLAASRVTSPTSPSEPPRRALGPQGSHDFANGCAEQPFLQRLEYKMTYFQKAILFLAGATSVGIGTAILIFPAAFHASYGITPRE